MDVITVESQAYKELMTKINVISKFVFAQLEKEREREAGISADSWVDSYEVCTFLKISSKTLQRLRARRAVSFSLIRGKTFYKISEIQRLLNENIIRRSDECMQDLIKNHRLHVEQRRNIKKDK
jgi:hypothetical protein